LIEPAASNNSHTASPRRNAAARVGAGQRTVTRVKFASSTNATVAVPVTGWRAGCGAGRPSLAS
jgi:uncharacterized membrane protein